MRQEQLKQKAAIAAMEYIEEGMVIGVGSGSTIKYFIEALASFKHQIEGAVASSITTENLLRQANIPIVDLNTMHEIPLYVDGADSFNKLKQLVKGGGGALTREKIIAAASLQFLCIVDNSKKEDVLGRFPIPIEVIPMARSYVAREIIKIGGHPTYREHFVTDNGNIILDVHGWQITEPISREEKLNNIAGVVTNGLFAKRGADKILIAHPDKIETL